VLLADLLRPLIHSDQGTDGIVGKIGGGRCFSTEVRFALTHP